MIPKNTIPALVLAVALGLGLWAAPSVTAAPPSAEKPVKIVAIHNTAASADTGVISGGFQASSSYPVEAIRITVCVSGTATTMDLTVSDGTTTEELTFNSATALATGSLYTFTAGIANVDASGDALTYNIEFEDATTIDYLVIDRARVGAP